MWPVLPCWSNTGGGGVLLYVKDTLPLSNVTDYDDTICQVVVGTCDVTKQIIASLYRPPEAPVSSFSNARSVVSSYIREPSPNDDYKALLFGDFNFPKIVWSENKILPGGTKVSQDSSTDLLNFATAHLLTQQIEEPTRKQNTLDLLFTNCPSLVYHISVSETTVWS